MGPFGQDSGNSAGFAVRDEQKETIAAWKASARHGVMLFFGENIPPKMDFYAIKIVKKPLRGKKYFDF
jgi:hypothetical protein